jgi:DNA-directed RNA polymerase specialized sigma54-like protein
MKTKIRILGVFLLLFISFCYGFDGDINDILKRSKETSNQTLEKHNEYQNENYIDIKAVSPEGEDDTVPPVEIAIEKRYHARDSVEEVYDAMVQKRIDSLEYKVRTLMEIESNHQSIVESQQFFIERDKQKFDFWLNLAKSLGGVAGTLATAFGGNLVYKKYMAGKSASKEDIKEAIKEAVQEEEKKHGQTPTPPTT